MTVAKTIRFNGYLKSIESVGAVVEICREFDYSNDLTEAACNYYNIAASTTNTPIPFGGVDTVKLVYIKPSLAISVRLQSITDTPITLNAGVSIFYGSLSAMYVTTGVTPVTVDVIVFG